MISFADVLQPQLRRPRSLLLAAAVFVGGLAAWQVYQTYQGVQVRSGTELHGPQVSIALERTVWTTGETARGTVTIQAADAATLRQDEGVVLDVYPVGAPQTPQNSVATVRLRAPPSLPAGGSAALQFELRGKLAPGEYVIGATVVAEMAAVGAGASTKAGGVAGFTVR